jgi:hypothetical protein
MFILKEKEERGYPTRPPHIGELKLDSEVSDS